MRSSPRFESGGDDVRHIHLVPLNEIWYGTAPTETVGNAYPVDGYGDACVDHCVGDSAGKAAGNEMVLCCYDAWYSPQ